MRANLWRDSPAEGWLSMDRYANELYDALTALQEPGFSVCMPDPPQSPRRSRHLARLLDYPRWVRSQPPGDIEHILDYSYGHLTRSLSGWV